MANMQIDGGAGAFVTPKKTPAKPLTAAQIKAQMAATLAATKKATVQSQTFAAAAKTDQAANIKAATDLITPLGGTVNQTTGIATPPVGGYTASGLATSAGSQSGGGGDGSPVGSPGAAWTWNGAKWVQPDMPTDSKSYVWDNEKGWVVPTATQADTSAMSMLLDGFKGLGPGMESAITNAWNLYKQGFNSDYIMNDKTNGFRNSAAYQNRFPGMKALNDAGQGVSEATYLQKEDNDRQLLYQYLGAGAAAYDNPQKLSTFITGFKDTKVLESDLQAVHDAVNSSPETKAWLQANYGISAQDLALHWLDPAVSTDYIQKQLTASEIGGAGIASGFGNLDKTQAEALATQGVTQPQAQSVFGKIGNYGQLEQNLPGNDTGSMNQQQILDASFTGGAAGQQLSNLQSRRVAQFQESGGAATTSAGVVGLRSAATP